MNLYNLFLIFTFVMFSLKRINVFRIPSREAPVSEHAINHHNSLMFVLVLSMCSGTDN